MHKSFSTRSIFSKIISSFISFTFLFSNIVYADDVKSGKISLSHGHSLARTSALAPIMLTWAGNLDENHIRALLSDVPRDAINEDELRALVSSIVTRFSEARREYESMCVEGWIRNTIVAAREDGAAENVANEKTIKEAYLHRVRQGLLAARSQDSADHDLTPAEIASIDAFVTELGRSSEFGTLFSGIYREAMHGLSPPSAPTTGPSAGAHRMHNGWLLRILNLRPGEDDALVESVGKIIDPAYSLYNDSGDIVIIVPISNFLADLIGADSKECIDQHKVHEVIEQILMYRSKGTGHREVPRLIDEMEKKIGLSAEERARFMTQITKLYGKEGFNGDISMMLAHSVAETIDDILFEKVDDHLPPVDHEEYGFIREVADRGMAAIYKMLKAGEASVAAGRSDYRCPPITEGVISSKYFTEEEDGVTSINRAYVEELRDNILALKICINAKMIPNVDLDKVGPKSLESPNNGMQLERARRETIMSFLQRIADARDDEASYLGMIKVVSRLLIRWSEDYGNEEVVRVYGKAIAALSSDDKRISLICEIGSRRAMLADFIYENISSISETRVKYFSQRIEKIVDDRRESGNLEYLGHLVRLIGRIMDRDVDGDRVPSSDLMSIRNILKALYMEKRGRVDKDYLKEMENAVVQLKAIEEQIRALKEGGIGDDSEDMREYQKNLKGAYDKVESLNEERVTISLQHELDGFIVETLRIAISRYGRSEDSETKVAVGQIVALLMEVAKDQRPFSGLYFVREHALYALRDAGYIPEVRAFLESIVAGDISQPGDWTVPEQQHYGTSPSYSPVSDLRFVAGTAIIFSERERIKSDILKDPDIDPVKIVRMWEETDWKDAASVAIYQIMDDRSVSDETRISAINAMFGADPSNNHPIALSSINSIGRLMSIFQNSGERPESKRVREAAGFAIFRICKSICDKIAADLEYNEPPAYQRFNDAINNFNRERDRMISLDKRPSMGAEDFEGIAYEVVDALLNSLVDMLSRMDLMPHYGETIYRDNKNPHILYDSPRTAGISGGGASKFLKAVLRFIRSIGAAIVMTVSDTGGSTKSQLALAMAVMHLDIFAIGDLLKAMDMPEPVSTFLGARLKGTKLQYEGKTLRQYIIEDKRDIEEGGIIVARNTTLMDYYISTELPKYLHNTNSVPDGTLDNYGNKTDEIAQAIAARFRAELEQSIDIYDKYFVAPGHATLHKNSIQNMIMMGFLIKEGAFCYKAEDKNRGIKSFWYRNIYGINMAFIKFSALVGSGKTFADMADFNKNYPRITREGTYPVPVSIYPNDVILVLSNGSVKYSQDCGSHTFVRPGLRIEEMQNLYSGLPENYFALRSLRESNMTMEGPTSFFTSMLAVLKYGSVSRIIKERIDDTRSLGMWISPVGADNEETIGRSMQDIIFDFLDGVGALPNVILYVSQESVGDLPIEERIDLLTGLSSGQYSGPFMMSRQDIENLKRNINSIYNRNTREKIIIQTEDELDEELTINDKGDKRDLSASEWRNRVILVPIPASSIESTEESSRFGGGKVKVFKYNPAMIGGIVAEFLYKHPNRPVLSAFPLKSGSARPVAIPLKAHLKARMIDGKVEVERGSDLTDDKRAFIEDAINRYISKSTVDDRARSDDFRALLDAGIDIEVGPDVVAVAEHDDGRIMLYSGIFDQDIDDPAERVKAELGMDMILEHEFFHMTEWSRRGKAQLSAFSDKLEEEKGAVRLTASGYSALPQNDRARLREFMYEFSGPQAGIQYDDLLDIFNLFDLIDAEADRAAQDRMIDKIAATFVRIYDGTDEADARPADAEPAQTAAKTDKRAEGARLSPQEIQDEVTMPDIDRLNDTLFVMKPKDAEAKAAMAKQGKVIMAWDTKMNNTNAMLAAKLISQNLGDSVIHIRGTGAALVDQVRQAMADNAGNIRSVVSVAHENTLKEMTLDGVTIEDALSALQIEGTRSSVLNVRTRDEEGNPIFVSIPALYDLALSIGFDMGIEKIKASMHNVGYLFVGDEPIDPLTLNDDDILKALRVLRLLPRTKPEDVDADIRAQNLARNALQASL